MRWLTAIPVYNEARHVRAVLAEVRRYTPDILVVNDGSTDGTPRSAGTANRTCGSSRTARTAATGPPWRPRFEHVPRPRDFDVLVTMDCDGQHEPARIPVLLEAIHDADIVSGSRYLRDFRQDTPAAGGPAVRSTRRSRAEINARYGLHLTDAFCGFKAYRRAARRSCTSPRPGWGMPLQLWVQAARHGLRVKEVGVPRLYLDPNRAFGGDAERPGAAAGVLPPACWPRPSGRPPRPSARCPFGCWEPCA